MAAERAWASLLVATLAAIGALGVLVLVPRGAEAVSPTAKACGGGTIALNADEERLLRLHNRARAKRDLKPLCVHPALTAAARSHSQDMLDRDYASHVSPDGEGVKGRLRRFGYGPEGYRRYAIGENIAWGCGSRGRPERLFGWWMRSRGHRSNILGKGFREVGIGALSGAFKGCDHAAMYTVDFGGRRR